jgi:enoyl-CoA hydratase
MFKPGGWVERLDEACTTILGVNGYASPRQEDGMAYENLIFTKNNGIATITFNRPEVRNALNLATWKEIRQVIEEVEDQSIQVLIFTGAGDEAFAAGTDIKWLHERSMLATLEAYSQRVLQMLEDLWKPSIAAVNGFALGGGCELAMACDIRIASEQAKFGQPEVRLGILPGAGGTQRLPRLVGVAKAKELIFSGEIIDAATAERIGLVNRVVPHAKLMESAMELANKITRQGPVAIQLAKAAINTGVNLGPGAGYVCERLAQTVLFGTEDRIEGTSAFLEKRRPDFKGA